MSPKSSADKPPEFQSDMALELMEAIYPLILQNCTDDEDDIDTQAVLETLAGLLGMFLRDYQEQVGEEKTSQALRQVVDLAQTVYVELQ